MLAAQRAPVKPRVLMPASGVLLPLEDKILELLAAGKCGTVYVAGPAGSGKTTALRHLAAVLPADAPVTLMDAFGIVVREAPGNEDLILRAVAPRAELRGLIYELTAWSDDDLAEYLLALHHDQCTRVMARIENADRELFEGIPELWAIALDRMARDLALPNGRTALVQHLQQEFASSERLERAGRACLRALVTGGAPPSPSEALNKEGFPQTILRLIRHAPVQLLLAGERIAADVREGQTCKYLERRLPRVLIEAAAGGLAGSPDALQLLRERFGEVPAAQPMTASLLCMADPTWTPRNAGAVLSFEGAYLDHAVWPNVQLAGARLTAADLSYADLRQANIQSVEASQVNLRRARLSHAVLMDTEAVDAVAPGVDLSSALAQRSWWNGANLEGALLISAQLTGASFRGSNLVGANLADATLVCANLVDARVAHADFSRADLRSADLAGVRLCEATLADACLAEANLSQCDMEGMQLSGNDLSFARLERALLTAAELNCANLEGACLQGAGLGDVNMEGACLRNADLRGATFHMGSSRGGLVFSPYACEGSRTGFYTDDADDQNFKAPEEIRKANLRGADLRGARLDDVDFYLVDLRDARYDPEQEEHFRRCRAILSRRREDA